MPYSYYRSPPPELAAFYRETLPQLLEQEEYEAADLAKRLNDLYSGPKREFSLSLIRDYFSWLIQAGLIEHREQADPRRGGWTFVIRRIENVAKIKHFLKDPRDIKTGSDIDGSKDVRYRPRETDREPLDLTKAAASVEEPPKKKKKKKKKKRCCDNPHIVRSKKTGKRRCKNCGAKYKSKKTKDE